MTIKEVNFDGLVGPTHHYAGLAPGNLASTENAFSVANPRAAALEGLAKMRLLLSLGIPQGILPPHQRPDLWQLQRLGFTGSAEQQITKAFKEAPELLSACYSASSMWAANAATISASQDSMDNRVHFTAANLVSNLHRRTETSFSTELLKKIFNDETYFHHHHALPATTVLGDEGAANHSRLCKNQQSVGLNFFVYGKSTRHKSCSELHFPARQTLEASMSIARLHQLDSNHTIYAQQHPNAINKGVFHNDVISVANENVLLAYHQAWLNQENVVAEISKKAGFDLIYLEATAKHFALEDAVSSYLYNSQLITLANQEMALIAPIECNLNKRIKQYIDLIIHDKNNPISEVYFLNLKQSMRNGGGPACLRLRVPLSAAELTAMHQGVLLSTELIEQLEYWVIKHYRQELTIKDLSDPLLIKEIYTAFDELTHLLKLGSVYPFQCE